MDRPPHEISDPNFPDGWLQQQVEKSARSLDGLDPQVRAVLAHRTGRDNAAGTRGIISRLQQLNDDGTPAHPVGAGQEIIGGWVDEVQHFAAPPTQEESPALAAEQGTTRRGQSSAVEVAELGYAIGRNVSAAGSPTPPLPMHSVLAALEQLQSRAWGSQTLLNLHLIEVSDKTLRCAPRCAGPGKHLDEYRAADVRPSTEQTKRNSAAGS